MSNLFWTVSQTPVREHPNASSRKLVDVPPLRIVSVTGRWHDAEMRGVPMRWAEVVYIASNGRRYAGWSYTGYLEELREVGAAPVVEIEHQTEDPHDAAQYMIWRGKVQYNMCGELCICYISGVGLSYMLTQWQAKEPSFFARVFGTGMARGTNLAELDSMLKVFGRPTPSLTLQAALHDAILERPVVTPPRFTFLLRYHRIIAGVKISKTNGRLQPSGILHWVVLEAVNPDGINQGWVSLYNPFTNKMEMYSWAEFTASMGAPYGICVER